MSWSEWDLLDEILNILKLGSTHVLVMRVIKITILILVILFCSCHVILFIAMWNESTY